jgi:hypothetical protein
MRARSYVSPAEWQARLDSLMRAVLAEPERYHPSIGHWARWRFAWLARGKHAGEGGSNLCHDLPQTAARAKFLRAAARLNATGREEADHEET